MSIKSGFARRRTILVWRIAAAALGFGIVFGIASPANADIANLNGTQETGIKVYGTPRVDKQARNYDRVIISNMSNGGPPVYVGMARSGQLSYAASGNAYGSWSTIANKSGGTYNPPGTFFLKVEIVGGCGGSGCGQITWNGILSYNVSPN